MPGCTAGLFPSPPAAAAPRGVGRGPTAHGTAASSTTCKASLRRLPRAASLSPQAELLQGEPAAASSGRRIDAASPSVGGGSSGAPAAPGTPSTTGSSPGSDGWDNGGESADEGLVVTTFRWPAALGGHEVSVCGSFSDWEPLQLHQASSGGDFVRSVALPPGSAYFKYLVDGDWICSPCEQVVRNGKGYNNHRLVQATASFTWRTTELGGTDVLLTGSFNSWAELVPLCLDPSTGLHTLRCCLPQGDYQFQYFVDGQWLLCPTQPTCLTDQGRLVNSIHVHSPPAFTILYSTGWKGALLHYRFAAPPGQPQQEWQAVAMHSTASRAAPNGGIWLTATVPALPLPHTASHGSARSNGSGGGGGEPAARNGSRHAAPGGEVAGLTVADGSGGEAEQEVPPLDFFFSSPDGSRHDRPAGSDSTYRCLHPGGYKLLRGQLRPFPMATQPPMMLVSDLDGTMVGEGEEADACTRDFAAYWEDNAALAGGVLVYNTGRSLGQFQGLLDWKAGALPVPDVLITAVGTKVWRLDTEGGTRGTAPGTSWQEDHQWARTLDEGWSLEGIRRCIGAVVDGSHGAASWLDNGTEHPHRVCISSRADTTPAITAAIQQRVEAEGLQVKVIVSGTGDWRYIDVTSARAGKLAALEYVRQLYDVQCDRCVAAGDSGNDTLMLGGRNLAIVVGNAQPELVQWVLQQPQEERLVVTDAPMARGILEGLARHGLY
ncbi:putative sucrose-phosphatase 2 [Chlorella vulgaris]